METASIPKPALKRLAYTAGVKSISDDSHIVIQNIMENKLDEILEVAVTVNNEINTKTLMPGDIYKALEILGYNVAQSNYLGTTTVSGKKKKNEKKYSEEEQENE